MAGGGGCSQFPCLPNGLNVKTSEINLKMIALIGLLALLFAGITAVFLDRNYGPQPLLRFQGKSSAEMAARVDFDFGHGWDKEARSRIVIKESNDFRPYCITLPGDVPRKMKINFDAMGGVFELKDFRLDLDRSGRIVDSGFSFKAVSETSAYNIQDGGVIGHGLADQKLPSLRIYLPEDEGDWPRLGGTLLFWKRFGFSFLFGFLIVGAVLLIEAPREKPHE